MPGSAAFNGHALPFRGLNRAASMGGLPAANAPLTLHVDVSGIPLQPGAETVASVATGSVFSSAMANTTWLTAKVLMVIERSLSLCPDWAVASSMGLLLLVISGFALLVLYGAAARVRHLGWAASDEEPEPSRPIPLAGAFMQAGPSIPWCGALPCRHAPHPHRAGAGC